MKLNLITLLMILAGATAMAQTEQRNSADQIIPASPNVAAFQKYIDYPVQLSTGVPEISIPVYTINVAGFSYPIALSYHASGIKVGDISSDVGLGWSLSAGGMVNVNVNGLMDDRIGGSFVVNTKIKNRSLTTGYTGPFVSCSVLPDVMNATLPYQNLLQFYSGTDLDFFRAVIYGEGDSEPDLYTYSTATGGGKFFKDENNIFRTIPASDNKIEQILNSSSNVTGYKVTDGKGICYYFESMQQTTSVTNGTCGVPGSISADTRVGREYYLTKITTPKGGEIDFHYSATPGYSYNLPTQQTRAYYLGPQASDYNNAGPDGTAYQCSNVTTVTEAPLRLDMITTNTGTTVNLSYNTDFRKDLPANSMHALQNISVSNGTNTITSLTLNQDYFGGLSTDFNANRLKLLSVQRSGEQPYVFTYNVSSTIGLPSRLSPSIDHYGYYNGQPNTTLLPLDEYDGFVGGGDRSPHPEFVQADMLTQVTYPTGGYVQYTYEPNTYWKNTTTTQNQNVLGPALYSKPDQTVSTVFTLPSNVSQFILHYEDSFDGTNQNVDECRIWVTFPDGTMRQFLGNNYQPGISLTAANGAIQPGQYTVRIDNVGSTYNADLYFSWYQQNTTGPHNEIGGGVRINQIQSFNAANQVAYLKRFEYLLPGTTQSSGTNTFEPVYLDYKNDDKFIKNIGTGSCIELSLQAIVQSTNSINPLLTSDGYSVSYSDVVEYDVDKTQNGYTHYLYNNDNNSNAGQTLGYPYAPLINYDWVKGELLEKDTYKYQSGNYVLINKLVNTYNYNTFDPNAVPANTYMTYGAKVGMTEQPTYCDNCNASSPLNVPLSNIQFGVQYYQYYSSWHYLTQSQTTDFDLNGLNPGTVTNSYYYDNPTHLQLTRTVTTKSNGKVVTTAHTFPDDYASGTSFIDDMKSSHEIALPIEQITYQDDASGTQIMSGQISQYQPGGKGLTDQLFRWESANPVLLSLFKFSSRPAGQLPYGTASSLYGADSRYQSKITFNNYDALGNPLQITPTGGPSTTYLWGYNNQYPVAEIRNSTYQAVVNALGQSVVDGLNSSPGTDATIRSQLAVLRTALPNAQVTIYTYAPLAGMTSATDARGMTTYYEYDSFQRLMNIKDKDGNIVKHLDYHYQNQ